MQHKDNSHATRYGSMIVVKSGRFNVTEGRSAPIACPTAGVLTWRHFGERCDAAHTLIGPVGQIFPVIDLAVCPQVLPCEPIEKFKFGLAAKAVSTPTRYCDACLGTIQSRRLSHEYATFAERMDCGRTVCSRASSPIDDKPHRNQ